VDRCAGVGGLMATTIRSLAGERAARRGGRCPVVAPTVAVDAARRLRCASRSALARRNSLRSLRSLRSDNRRESDVDARALRAPSAPLRCLPPHKSPPPGTTHRAAAARAFDKEHGRAGKAADGCAPTATLCDAEERGARGRARAARASSSDSPRLSERSERRERSEFRDGPRDRVPQGSRPAGPTVAHERRHTRPRLCLARPRHGALI
jgi:hypothetical protein